MSGFCSAHKHYEPGCPQCEAIPGRDNLETARNLLEQVISTMEMIHNFGDGLANKDELMLRTMRRVVKAQEIIESCILGNDLRH